MQRTFHRNGISILAVTAFLASSVANAQSVPDPKLLDVPTTKVLAIGSFTPTTSPKVWLPMVPREAKKTADLYFDGKIDQWYVKQDKTGVVFVMNVKTADEAHALLDKLPMGVAGVMKFEMIPLGPISPIRMIMTNPEN
ncbi:MULTISPECIES: hypothetical protein [unclassified Rhizobium]|uniref:hypothetical protein n=1 Tax=unclassified Rhizobium TaxID=2613769 RepID=UPI00104FE674|nr:MULTISPECIES: hypothetical protein [unclassified Rhizobium]NKJ03752.1 hypothetical protein [Rhizobium sp. SG741]TCR76835.1 muconolactone delta-isomerase [Rhizobium sp. BK376]